jgi:CRISPR-associated protein Cas1
MPTGVTDPDPLLPVHALRALKYCERLFYLEAVEGNYLANEPILDGRRLHEEVLPEEGERWERLTTESAALGLRGELDCLRRRDGSLIPYEHKKGRSCKGEGGPEAWDSDRLQVIGYAALVAEWSGQSVPEARIRYHEDNSLVRVAFDDQARTDLRAALDRVRELRGQVERPPVSDNERKCVHCALVPACLPEEERAAESEDHQAVRLFPPAYDRQIIHVTEPGARIGRAGDRLTVVGEEKREFPIRSVRSLVLHGQVQISTQALGLCEHHGISVHWVTGGGRYLGAFAAGVGRVHCRLRQYEALRDPERRLALSRRLVHAKAEQQLRFLMRCRRQQTEHAELFADALARVRRILRAIDRSSIDELLGLEGEAAAAYFSCFPALLRADLDARLRYERRSRRPPKDRVNCLLGFGYASLYRDVLSAITVSGLESAFGFYHQPRSSAHPLALDLMELFRVALVDMPVIASLNRGQWDPGRDFVETKGGVWLSDAGRKQLIEILERRKAETWKHPVIGYSLSYDRLIELEARLLDKELGGGGELFARWRLR